MAETVAVGAPAKRTYQSTLRRAQAELTRTAVLDAAGRLFAERGYAAATMQSIADAAGVAVETVYAQGTKSSILAACVDRALVGDDEPVPFLDRDEVATPLASGDQVTMVRGWARAIAALASRSCRILAAFEQGAASDPAVAELWSEYEGRRRQDYERVVTMVAEAGPLPDGRDIATTVDVLWALISPDTAIALLLRCGWDRDHFTELVVDLAVETLLPSPPFTDPRRRRKSP